MSDSDEVLEQQIDAVHRLISAHLRDLFDLIVECDLAGVWEDSGARDLAHWLSMRYGISNWKARRWIASAHALRDLPLTAAAFASGELGIDKVVELTRFATPESEFRLILWAREVSAGCIRRKGDLATRHDLEEVREADRNRSVDWWYSDDGRRFSLEADLTAADGAVVARALSRLSRSLPVMPGEEGPDGERARRADALVAMCSSRVAADPDPHRATVVVHATDRALMVGSGGCEIEGGPVIHPETARRLACTARVQTVMENSDGEAIGMGRMSRDPSPAMVRYLRYRDWGCTFPGCGTRHFTQAHHIVWWERGGRTDLDNLVLVCFFHHKLVHEYRWSLHRDPHGIVRWFRPDGARHRAGPAPPPELIEPRPALSAAV